MQTSSNNAVNEESREPYYIYLQNSELNAKLQKYISAFVQHIASILEKDAPNTRRIVSFLPEKNGKNIIQILNKQVSCFLDFVYPQSR